MDASEANVTFQVKIVQTQVKNFTLNQISDWIKVDIKLNSPDLKFIQSDKQIGIDTSREIKEFFTTTPIHLPYKIVVIEKADTLTIPAQQALLKVLEEPPSFGYVLLITNNPYKLLSTIRSRSQIIAQTDLSKEIISSKEFLIPNKIGDRLNIASTFGTKEKAFEHIESLIWYFRNLMLTNPNQKIIFNLTVTLFAAKMLKSNVTASLAMDYLYLMLK